MLKFYYLNREVKKMNCNNAYTMLIQAASPEQLKAIESRRLELLNIAFNLQKKNRQSKKAGEKP